MSSYFTDDPLTDFERYSVDAEDSLAYLPTCGICGEPIQQDTAVFIDEQGYCDNCLRDSRRGVERIG